MISIIILTIKYQKLTFILDLIYADTVLRIAYVLSLWDRYYYLHFIPELIEVPEG